MQLENKTAVVTGGSSGIGRKIALEFAEEGANVAVGDIQRVSDYESTSTVEEIEKRGGNAVFGETDVTKANECRQLTSDTVDQFGGIDILVNNAGGFPPESRGKNIEELPKSEWENILELNLKGVYNCTRHAIPRIRESDAGRVINITSKMALVGHPNAPAYSAAKGGIVSVTKQNAVEYADEGITVNSITPGIIETGTKQYRFEDKEEQMRDNTLLPFLGEPKDVARSAVFLASEDGRFITGHNLVVDGGWTSQ